MNVKRFLRVGAVGLILLIAVFILIVNVHANSNLWMLEISEDTALSYNQLCVVDENGHLYSLAAWVPAPMHKTKLRNKGVVVEDYATIYEQLSYDEVVAYGDAPVPIVTDDALIRHYYSADESVVSFREAVFTGYDGELKTYSINSLEEHVFNGSVGEDGYSTYDLSTLPDGLYYVNPGGMVELRRAEPKRSK